MASVDPTVKLETAKPTKAKPKSIRETKQKFAKAQRAAILLKQASDPTRLRVLHALSEGEKHVGALCTLLDQTQPAVSHHLALLRHGGLIAARRQGKNNYYALTGVGRELAKVVTGILN